MMLDHDRRGGTSFIGSVIGDRLMQVALGVFALLTVIEIAPLPSGALDWTPLIPTVELLLIFLGMAAALRLAPRDEPIEELRFWRYWALAYALWFIELAIYELGAPSMWASVAADILILGMYVCLGLAFLERPHAEPSTRSDLKSIESAGLIVFALGAITYTVIIPLALRPALFATDIPSQVLYVVGDAAIIVHLRFLRNAKDARWRTIYRWLLVSAVLGLVYDATDLMRFGELLNHPATERILDWGWGLQHLVFIGTATLRLFIPVTVRVAGAPANSMRLGIAPLRTTLFVPSIVFFPLLQVLMDRFDLLDPRTREWRQACAFVVAVTLATLATIRQRRMESVRLRASQVEHRAHHDELTGLPNRYLFLEQAQAALVAASARSQHVAFLFVDLDRFKVINDSLGHALGDKLLQAVAHRLRSSLRYGDTLARLGGDEFVVLMSGLPSREPMRQLAERIVGSMKEPFEVEGARLFVTGSVGVGVFPDDGAEPGALLGAADLAMYRAKQMGGQRAYEFDALLRDDARDRLALEAELRSAESSSQFELHYQPILDSANRRTWGLEGLLRWRHPVRGPLLPEVFFEAAVNSGVLGRMTPWLVRQACRDLMQTSPTGDLRVSINLSAASLLDPKLVTEIRDALGETGLAPSRLLLEVAETVAVADVESVTRVLRELKKLGVGIVLDDFGAGYSSLGYLTLLPLDGLKLAGSLVAEVDRDRRAAAIVKSVVGLGRDLGLTVIAEGVERETQTAFLVESRCALLQGFAFSPALTVNEVQEWLTSPTDIGKTVQ